MRSIFLDLVLSFDTPDEAVESEDVLLRLLTPIARKNMYYLRRHPEIPRLYSREAGIRWCPPDQAQGPWISRGQIRDFAADLRGKWGMREDRAAIVTRLVSGVEIFQDIPTLYRAKKGDCDRLTVARLAELWLAGIMATPYLIPHPNDRGGTTYHAGVKHLDGSFEDVSVLLGMPCAPGKFEEEVKKNLERRDNLLAAAAEIMVVDGASPDALGAIVDQACYVPPGGFRRAA